MLKVQKILGIVLLCLVVLMLAGFTVLPAVTGKTLFDFINPPRGGNVYGFTIKDVNGDTLEVEVNSFNISEQARQIKESGESRWIGGKLVPFDNEWGFRFNPDTIIFADVVAEGLQTTLQLINEDLDYWMQFDEVYVYAEITEVWVEHGIGRVD